MNNYEMKSRIKQLEEELKSLKAECIDPMMKLRIRREEVLIGECDFPKIALSSDFGGPLLTLIRNTARIDANTMRRITDNDDWELFFSMQDELLSVVAKYSGIFKVKEKQRASIMLNDLYIAARKYKRVCQLGHYYDKEYFQFVGIFEKLKKAGYTEIELQGLIAENT